jgi:hypothetical protein
VRSGLPGVDQSGGGILNRGSNGDYSIGDLGRREILRMSAALAIGSVASTRFTMAQTTAQRTPEQILGPFYPMKTLDQNADLTKVPGRPGRAAGLVLNVMGRVLNLRGEPVRNAKVKYGKPTLMGVTLIQAIIILRRSIRTSRGQPF